MLPIVWAINININNKFAIQVFKFFNFTNSLHFKTSILINPFCIIGTP